ncbi:hypothetical protein BFP75_19450 [Maribacter sp. 4G9]|nr:hypothetical protein BFP75_19450 [Maribacter sp. 4G9]
MMVFPFGCWVNKDLFFDTFSIAEKVSKKARLILVHLKSKKSSGHIAQVVSDYIGILFGRFPFGQIQVLPDLLRIPK